MHAPFFPDACQVAGALLRAHALSCRRGGRILLEDVSLSVSAGELLWLRGANGQGKSSLLRLLAGLSRPAAGHVERMAPVLYLGHQDALHGELHAWEALRFLANLHGAVAPESAWHAALAQAGVGACAHVPIHALSQGQRKRVALARLLLSPPTALWLLDEPLDALDDQGVAQVAAWLQAHRARGGAVVLTSHQRLPPGLADHSGGAGRVLDLAAHAPCVASRQGDEVHA